MMHLHKAFELGMVLVYIQKENKELEARKMEIMAVGTALVVVMRVVHKASQMGMGLDCIQRENRELLAQKQGVVALTALIAYAFFVKEVDNEHILHLH